LAWSPAAREVATLDAIADCHHLNSGSSIGHPLRSDETGFAGSPCSHKSLANCV
jgi:hypothetical protein